MKKRILGITVLLAVLAMCVTFTACVVDQDERSVTFVNYTAKTITLSFKNVSAVILQALPSQSATGDQVPHETRTKKGEDIILMSISFEGGTTLEEALDNGYLDFSESSLVPGETVKNQKGMSLAYGTMVFRPATGVSGGNPLNFPKIGMVTLDD